MLCSKKARMQFDKLFFIDFPKDKKLCDIWWKICGHNDTFDSSFKICSIHFDVNNFTTVIIKQDNQFSRQTVLKNINIVPTLYLLPHEYTKFIRKRKKTINDNNSEYNYSILYLILYMLYTNIYEKINLGTIIPNKFAKIVNCSILGCNKTSLIDDKRTYIFK